jgi:hypothetical protein
MTVVPSRQRGRRQGFGDRTADTVEVIPIVLLERHAAAIAHARDESQRHAASAGAREPIDHSRVDVRADDHQIVQTRDPERKQ